MLSFFSELLFSHSAPTKNLLRTAPQNDDSMPILKSFNVFFPIQPRLAQIKHPFKPSYAFGDPAGRFGTAFDTT